MVLAPQLLGLFGYHGALGVNLARIIFPTVVLLGLNGLQNAILNALDEFFLPAIAPVAWNVVIVGTLALSLPFLHTTDTRIYAYAIGILLGTVAQFAIPYPAMRRLGRLAWFCDPSDEAVQRVFALMLPVTLGLGPDQPQPAGRHLVRRATWTTTSARPRSTRRSGSTCCRRGCSPSPWLPCCSRRSRGARPLATGRAFATWWASGCGRSPSCCCRPPRMCAALATPIVRLLYEHGSFTPHETVVVASCLAAFSLGLAFNGAMLLLNRAFFSMQMAWVPTYVAIANLTVNATLDWVLSRSLGVWSIPLATSIANIFGVAPAVPRAAPGRGPAGRARAAARARAHRGRDRRSRWPRPTASGAPSTRCWASTCCCSC